MTIFMSSILLLTCCLGYITAMDKWRFRFHDKIEGLAFPSMVEVQIFYCRIGNGRRCTIELTVFWSSFSLMNDENLVNVLDFVKFCKTNSSLSQTVNCLRALLKV